MSAYKFTVLIIAWPMQAALVTGESMLSFGFAAVALEIAFAKGWLLPFGTASKSVAS